MVYNLKVFSGGGGRAGTGYPTRVDSTDLLQVVSSLSFCIIFTPSMHELRQNWTQRLRELNICIASWQCPSVVESASLPRIPA